MRPQLIAGLLTIVLAHSTVAQSERRERFYPMLMLETGARMGACDALLFTPDGSHLLAGGDDRVVRTWRVGSGMRLEVDNILRWSIWRDRRGAIYAMALSPDAKRVAIGGLGVRNGSVVVLDRLTGAVVQALGQDAPRELLAAPIRSLAFSPSGRRLLIGTDAGGVWLWDLVGDDKTVRELGKHKSEVDFWPIRLVAFRDEQRAVSAGWGGEVLLWSIAEDKARAPVRIESTLRDVFRVALSPDKAWVAIGGSSSEVQLVSLEGRTTRSIALGERKFPDALAFSPRGEQLAVGVRTVPADGFYRVTASSVVLCDLRQARPEPQAGPKCDTRVEALVFHPDGRHLAVAGGADLEVTMWDMDAWAKGPRHVVRGPGRCLWGVGLSADGRYLAYQDRMSTDPSGPNQQGTGPWRRVFDLERRQRVPVGDFQSVRPVETSAGWCVEPGGPFVWHVRGPGGVRHKLPLDKADDSPRCYTFLPLAPDGSVRLAVGHYWGVSIFSLTPKEVRRSRLLSGHQEFVTSVVATPDGKLLATASRDQTLALWSLADWPNQPALGASFSLRVGALYVDRVAPGSPAWEAGLNVGDQVTRLDIGEATVPGGPIEWSKRLKQPTPGRVHTFDLQAVEQMTPHYARSELRERPVLRFFPAQDGEWVLWRHGDFYYDTSATGDAFLGWQRSGDVNRTPEFLSAEQFKERYYRPDKVADAIRNIRFEPERRDLEDELPPRLIFRVESESPGRGLVVALGATPRGPREVHLPARAHLWIGDFRYRSWDLGREALPEKLAIPESELRSGTNRLTFQCYCKAGSLQQEHADVSRAALVERSDPPDRPDLYVVLVGVANYSRAKSKPGAKPLDSLQGVEYELDRLRDLWERKPPWFRRIEMFSIDEHVSRGGVTAKAILDSLESLHDRVRPNDLLVFYFSGHGYSEGPKPGSFTLVCSDFDFGRLDQTSLTSQKLYGALTRLRCRKLVLLNACHSGDVASNPVRDLTPDGVGPVVLSAAEPHEVAFAYGRRGGLFTQALVEACTDRFRDADTSRDGVLDCPELARYVCIRVPQILAELKVRKPEAFKENEKNLTQTPCCFPDISKMERFPVWQQ